MTKREEEKGGEREGRGERERERRHTCTEQLLALDEAGNSRFVPVTDCGVTVSV